ncbi:hypothetical protein [Microbacterium sp. 179-I 3D4 NHS]|uniref:hypothetical protein n=1 Tax=Microbacterium sp. 179-I 3D4 NHS TaxID=3142381 RepID=UPI0039A1537F
MKDDFLRPPRTPAEWTADALRLAGLLGVLAAAIWLQPTDAGIAALALPALVLPRMLGLRAWFDVTAGAVVLVAAWSNVFELYTSIPGWDLLLHFACTGVLAIVAAVVLTRTGVVMVTRDAGARARTPLVLLPLIALAISALWEMIEWLGWTYISDDIFVTYQDTIGDMVFGGLGGIAAGIVLARVAVERGVRVVSAASAR